MPRLRIIFMGTPELACASLEALLQVPDFEIIAAVTQPDRPKGRDLKLAPPPVKTFAQNRGVAVLQPERARDEAFIGALRERQPELIAVAAYGQILPPAILDLPRFGCLNVHTSLLPRYRGAAPIQWAILNGDAETGVTIMKMDEGMDTGPIVTQERTVIRNSDDGRTLHDRLAVMGGALLVRTIPDYIAAKIVPQPQPIEGILPAPKIKKKDGQIDWTQPADAVSNRVRGLVPWPGAFTFLPLPGQKRVLKIWTAQPIKAAGDPGAIVQADKTGVVVACGREAIRIDEVQVEGGRRMTVAQFLAGHPLNHGDRLGL